MALKNYFKVGKNRQAQAEKEVAAQLPAHGAVESGMSSAKSSMPPSIYSGMSSSAGTPKKHYVDEIRHEVMCNYLYQQQCGKGWLDQREEIEQGIIIRKSRGNYIAAPPDLSYSRFAANCSALNVQSAMTVSSKMIKIFLECSPDAVDVPLRNGLRVQILPNLEDLKRARIHQCAAFIANEKMLVVWDDEARNLMARAQLIEDELMELVWKEHNEEEDAAAAAKEKYNVEVTEMDEETGQPIPSQRPTMLYNTIYVSLTLLIIVVFIGLGVKSIAVEMKVDNGYIRILFLLITPIQCFFSLFFFQVVVGCVAQCMGPVKQMTENSKYYSGKLPPRIRGTLPHVTIQCPVYKEGLQAVIQPTVRSIKAAISTYELQGGSANIFINDDGLQLISEEKRQERIDFYADHSIGWTARPAHGVDGFTRKGKFKKASNMNYGLMISNQVEDMLAEIQRPDDWTQADEAHAYSRCLTEVLEKHEGRAWADGNIRIGDYIILIDSDTEVPSDCLLDAASEMELSPEVGIMQFSSGVMQVVHTYFENGITFFTNLIYTAIRFCVANGDVAPFVGHNAILRWSAIQQVGHYDEDGYEKFWSESHVSEDFDMSLRLQCDGYIIRFAAWAGEGFKEGVSLTVYDELARWEKYAYGCNELLFNPVRYWFVRGPFTKLFKTFLWSNIRFTSKVTIISYIGTYYAIGAAWILTFANYFAIGWFNGYLDHYYLDSWKVWFSIIIVFNGLGNIALAIMRYRIGANTFFGALIENFKWILMLAIFLGGLSLHVSQALLSHMFEIDMQWGSTSKEAEDSNFFQEVPKVLKKFKISMTWSILMFVLMIVMALAPFVPWDWQIKDFVAILPLASVSASHFLLPIALNPALMTFTF